MYELIISEIEPFRSYKITINIIKFYHCIVSFYIIVLFYHCMLGFVYYYHYYYFFIH